MPEKLIHLIRELYHNTTCRVLHQQRVGSQIPLNSGVRQGCILSPLLFNLVLDSVMSKVTQEQRGISWGLFDRLEDLDYADDVCLLSHSFTDMQSKLNCLIQEAAKVGLHLNIAKTKSMRIGTNNVNNFHILNTSIEEVAEFCYLGSIISKDGGATADVDNRIRKAATTFGMLNAGAHRITLRKQNSRSLTQM